jgi:Na+-driven multidrug efflux pump
LKRPVNKRVGRAFWTEATLASVAGALALLTLAWPDWIEGVFGVDPDRHSGALEWALVAICCVISLAFSALARREWQRAAPAQG